MKEEEKAADIDKAEGIIRQLAAEISRATSVAAEAEVRRMLGEAIGAVGEARRALEEAKGDTATCNEQLRVSARGLEATAQKLESHSERMAELLANRLNQLVSPVRWALIFAIFGVVAVLGIGFTAVLLLMRTR